MAMTKRHRDSKPAGDFDYESNGTGYGLRRQTDPDIERLVHSALGDAQTVLNVGAGTGSYEPADRYVVAIEPSSSMRSQRPPSRVPAMNATAEDLPFDDDSFDAAMAMVTVHQWGDAVTGLKELRRVSRGPVVVLTFDADAIENFWLNEYAPELIAAEKKRYPPIAEIARLIGEKSAVTPVPIPFDCLDGFTEAFFGRPEAFLEDGVRRSQSAWGFVDPEAEERSVAKLRSDLASGAWDASYGELRNKPDFIGSLRLIVGSP
jgi:Methyltransferase domain